MIYIFYNWAEASAYGILIMMFSPCYTKIDYKL